MSDMNDPRDPTSRADDDELDARDDDDYRDEADEANEADEADEADEGDEGDEGDEPALVDESAYAGDEDEDDDEDFGHLARLVDDVEEERREPAMMAENQGDPEIPLQLIDADALWVVKRLRAKGFEAYLTGGCVRDLLLGIPPKDFDVATAAHPHEVKSVFRNCRLIGRRFRLAHVFFSGGKVIETATFRANPLDELEDLPEDLLVERDNVFGTVEDDARRRDLTINGLFYDPLAGRVLDFVDGRRDLELRLIRTIGDPQIRFREDPVRILRAIKFATRLDFSFEEKTLEAMRDHVGELVRCAPPRLQEELLRLLSSKRSVRAWRLCEEIGVAKTLVPELSDALDRPLAPRPARELVIAKEAVEEAEGLDEGGAAVVAEAAAKHALVAADPATSSKPAYEPAPPSPEERRERLTRLLSSLDEVRARDAEVSSAVLWGTLLLPAWEAFARAEEDGAKWLDATCNAWTERMRMTRRDKDTLWLLLKGLEQLRPSARRGHQARHTVTRPWFRESLMLYTIAVHASGESLDEVAKWKAIAANYDQPYRQPKSGERQPRAAAGGGEGARRPRRSRRGGGRRRRGGRS